jgi:D-3-phosphoglycerate dehydrogenase
MNIVELEPIGFTKEEREEVIQSFKQKGHHYTYFEQKPKDDSEKISRAKNADILIISNLPLNREVLKKIPGLKMLSVAFAGVDHIDMEYCRNNNITVSNAAEYSVHSVAELTLGMIVSLYRKISWNEDKLRSSEDRQGFLGNEIFGKTLGIIGTGRIGKKVAKTGKALGCRVVAYSRTPKEIPGIEYTELDNLLRESDIISIHIPLTKQTKGLIGKKELKLMKPSAILINTARGPVVDYESLSKALQQKKLAGAAIDVYEQEPPIRKDHPLLLVPNTLLLPHIGFATKEAIKRRGKIVTENIEQWFKGSPINKVE